MHAYATRKLQESQVEIRMGVGGQETVKPLVKIRREMGVEVGQ
jgi:hypothetical protein